MLKLALVSLLCASLLCAGVSAQKKCKSVVKTAKSAKLNLLLELVTAAGLGDLLDDVQGDFTIFAPTDKAILEALKALKVSKKDFVANKDLLAEILTYHVLPTAYSAEELAAFGEEGLPTLLGYDSSCSATDLGFKFSKKAATVVGGESSANVVTADVQACSTIVHVIDTVLVPCPIVDASDAKEIAKKKKLAEKKEKGETAEDEDEDEDEEEEEEDVEGDEDEEDSTYSEEEEDDLEDAYEDEEDEEDEDEGKKTTKLTKVTGAKAKSSKTVKVEEEDDEDEEDEEEEEEKGAKGKKSGGSLSCTSVLGQLATKSKTLIKALTVTKLSRAIDNKDAGLTLFAPTDEAFESTLEALGISRKDLLRDRKLLKEILEFHVLRTSITSAGFKKGGTYETLLGKNSSCKNSSLDIKVNKKKVTVDGGPNQATVVEADVEACSSTIHFIDTILLPCELEG